MGAPEPLNPIVDVGDTITLSQGDYLEGVGRLHLKVTAVAANGPIEQEPWVYLYGKELEWNGAEGRNRAVLARVSALQQPRAVDRPKVKASTQPEGG